MAARGSGKKEYRFGVGRALANMVCDHLRAPTSWPCQYLLAPRSFEDTVCIIPGSSKRNSMPKAFSSSVEQQHHLVTRAEIKQGALAQGNFIFPFHDRIGSIIPTQDFAGWFRHRHSYLAKRLGKNCLSEAFFFPSGRIWFQQLSGNIHSLDNIWSISSILRRTTKND